jgi:hypothetical protein
VKLFYHNAAHTGLTGFTHSGAARENMNSLEERNRPHNSRAWLRGQGTMIMMIMKICVPTSATPAGSR